MASKTKKTVIGIKNKLSSLEGLAPSIPGHENVPLFLSVTYSNTTPDPPKISFTSIYNQTILRSTEEKKLINNSKAVKHFDAGDISHIEYANVSILYDCISHIEYANVSILYDCISHIEYANVSILYDCISHIEYANVSILYDCISHIGYANVSILYDCFYY